MLRRFYQALSPNSPTGQALIRFRKRVQAIPYQLSGEYDEFLRIADMVCPRYTMLSLDRLESLHYLSHCTVMYNIPGAIVECGTWNGGAAAVAAAAAPGRDVWLYDSFEGLPPPSPEDGHNAWYPGWCAGSPDLAREILGKVGVVPHIVKGWFEDTLPVAEVGEIALLHVDADWYKSVRLVLETFYERIVPGGVVVIDDYGRWSGARKAADEFFRTPLLRSGRVARYLIKG